VPYLVLAAGLAATAVVAAYAHRASTEQARLRFENAADGVRHSIESRLDAYIATLRGGAGLFAASDDVRGTEFHAYVSRLELNERYPGIQGVGFTRLVKPHERESIAERVRAQGIPFRYWPEQPGTDIHAIVYLEPMDARNRIAFGYNMWSEPVRRDAMARARDTGGPAASGRVVLVQERADPASTQAGFLIYVPVYSGGGVPATVDERRARLIGFVYSPFRAGDLLQNIVATDEGPDVGFAVYDGAAEEGRPLHLSPAFTSPERFEVRRQVVVAGRPWTVVLRSPSASDDPVSSTIVLLLVVGGTLFSVAVFALMRTEFRARQRAERIAAELRESEEALREANRAKDEFLAVISHELRTPLNAIVGWASMLRKGQLSGDQEQRALEVIERNAAAQATLVEDLLDISRAVAGRLRLDISDVDVATVLRSALDAVKPLADGRGVRLEWRGEPALGVIRADPSRLQQVVWNLLQNGIKFTPEGGVVRLLASRAPDTLRIEVEDTGRGIEPEFLPFVFERFRQADTSTTRANSGVGLGLAIARHLVELHGGSIGVRSEGPGRGSTFTVTLPIRTQPVVYAPGVSGRLAAREDVKGEGTT
jgi:signal transduction histidine kinase